MHASLANEEACSSPSPRLLICTCSITLHPLPAVDVTYPPRRVLHHSTRETIRSEPSRERILSRLNIHSYHKCDRSLCVTSCSLAQRASSRPAPPPSRYTAPYGRPLTNKRGSSMSWPAIRNQLPPRPRIGSSYVPAHPLSWHVSYSVNCCF